jgi:iron(III) transport system permease protein
MRRYMQIVESYCRKVQSWIRHGTSATEPVTIRTLGNFPLILPSLYLVALLAAAVICIFVIVVFWSTFIEGIPSTKTIFSSFSLNNYREVVLSPLLPVAAYNTVVVAVGTTLVTLFISIPITWLVHRTNLKFKRFFIILIFLHAVLPGFVRVMGWIMLLSPEIGMINQMIRMVLPIETGPLSPYNIPFIIFMQGLSFVPTMFLMLGGSFLSIDPSLEESAETSGLNRIQVFRRISFPLVKPAVVAGSIYTFVTAASMFEIPALLAAPFNIHVFSTLMYDALQPSVGLPNFGIAGVFGMMLLVPTLALLYYYQKLIKLSHRYATVTGKGYRPKLTDLGSWQWLGLLFVVGYLLIDMVLPYLAVVWTSLLPSIQLPSMETFRNIQFSSYTDALAVLKSSRAIGNTVQLILFTGFFSMAVGLIMSWITLRTRMPGRFALDNVAMLPQVVPGIAMAFAMAFIGILLIRIMPLHGSVAAIIIVDTIRRIPFTTRTINSSLIQIHPELEEAVQTSGASKVVALRKVIIPLITPALMYSFIWSVINAYREVTTALFLLGPKNMVLSTVIWNRWVTGETDVAAAIASIMVGVMAIMVLVLLKVFPKLAK